MGPVLGCAALGCAALGCAVLCCGLAFIMRCCSRCLDPSLCAQAPEQQLDSLIAEGALVPQWVGWHSMVAWLCCVSAGFDPRFAGNAPAELAQLARPRYHIAGGQSIFFTRLPYTNPDLGAGTRATRFVSLGSVLPRLKQAGARAAAAADAAAAAEQQQMLGPTGAISGAAGGRGRAGIGHSGPDTQAAPAAAGADAAKQQKFLHALALVPASSMSIEALQTLPEGCGAYPYEQQQAVGQKRSGSTYEHVSW